LCQDQVFCSGEELLSITHGFSIEAHICPCNGNLHDRLGRTHCAIAQLLIECARCDQVRIKTAHKGRMNGYHTLKACTRGKGPVQDISEWKQDNPCSTGH